MWTIWRKKNNRSFNVLEMSSVAIKSVFLRSWNDSSTVICGVSYISLDSVDLLCLGLKLFRGLSFYTLHSHKFLLLLLVKRKRKKY